MSRENMTEEPGLEENFASLEETIEKLESDELSLEEAFNSYRAGMELLKKCNEQIDRVEKQVLKLGEAGQTEEFDNGEQ